MRLFPARERVRVRVRVSVYVYAAVVCAVVVGCMREAETKRGKEAKI